MEIMLYIVILGLTINLIANMIWKYLPKTEKHIDIWASSVLIIICLLLIAFNKEKSEAGIGLQQQPNSNVSLSQTWSGYQRECEYPDNYTVGQMLHRSNASGKAVHGQFGCDSKKDSWQAKAGYVEYRNIRIPALRNIFLRLHYSKNSESSIPIEIFFNKESKPRIAIYLEDQGDWNKFVQIDSISLGDLEEGSHTLIFKTNGQEYGVADLDKFELFK